MGVHSPAPTRRTHRFGAVRAAGTLMVAVALSALVAHCSVLSSVVEGETPVTPRTTEGIEDSTDVMPPAVPVATIADIPTQSRPLRGKVGSESRPTAASESTNPLAITDADKKAAAAAQTSEYREAPAAVRAQVLLGAYASSLQTAIRPGADSGHPSEVLLGCRVYGVDSINPSEGRSDVWMKVIELWRDTRLAYDPATVGLDPAVAAKTYMAVNEGEVWVPSTSTLNRDSSVTSSTSIEVIGTNGLVRRTTTKTEIVTSEMYFSWAPFQRDVVRVRVGLYEDEVHEVYLALWPEETGMFHGSESVAKAQGYYKEDPEYEILGVAATRITDDWAMDHIEVLIFTRHRAQALVSQVMFPLALVTLLSYVTVFMTGPTYQLIAPAPRMGTSVFVFLSGFVYLRFVVSKVIPMVPYFTLMESCVVFTLLVTAAPIVLLVWQIRHLYNHRNNSEKQKMRAERNVTLSDKIMMVAVPVLVAAFWGVFTAIGVYRTFLLPDNTV